jgi:vitamin B12 transporter
MRNLYLSQQLMRDILFIITIFTVNNEAYGDDAEVVLPPITVLAAPVSLNDQINNPQQLDGEEVTGGHERTVSDVLSGLPAITTTRLGGYGQLSGVFLRGAGGQGMMTLDDIPLLVSLPGLQNLDSLPSEAIKTAEIQRGPGASHYSFQALGGAIRLYSQDREETGGELLVEGGTFGTLRETLVGGVAGKLGRVTFTINRADAFDGAHLAVSSTNPEREPYRSTQGILHFSSDISNSLNWQGSMLYRNSWVGADKFGLDPHFRLALFDDPNNFGSSESWLAQNTFNMKISKDWSSHLQLGFTQLANKVNEASPTVLVSGLTNRLYLANWRNEYTLIENEPEKIRWLLNWGGQGRHETVNKREDDLAEDRTMSSGFLETEGQYHDLSGQIGFRFEHYDQFGDHTLFKAATAYQITPGLTLRASGGTGYRIPSYTEKLFHFFGNSNLLPERSASGDLSLEWKPLKDMRINVNGYYNRYDNLITQAYSLVEIPTGFGPISVNSPTTINVANASVKGVEVNTQYAWTGNLDIGFSYTYSDNRNLQTKNQLPLRPAHIARVWGIQKFTELPITLWVEAIARSSTWNDLDNSLPISQSIQLNASIRYNLGKQFEIYLRGENLTNNRASQFYSTDMPGAMVFGGFQIGI